MPKIGAADLHCNPAQRTAGAKVAKLVNPNAHLACMGATAPAQSSVVVQVQNQFGKATLKTGAPTQLCLPSWKSLTGPPNKSPAAPPDLSHFTCYSVSYAPGATPFKTPAGLTVKDQFSTKSVSVRVGKPMLLCVPTTKVVGGVTYKMVNSTAHLMCFGLSPTPVKKAVFDENQFGTAKLAIGKTKLLCLPSFATTAGPGT